MKANERFVCNCEAKPKCGKCDGLHLSEYHDLAEKLRQRALSRIQKEQNSNFSATQGGANGNKVKKFDPFGLIKRGSLLTMEDNAAPLGVDMFIFDCPSWIMLDTGASCSAVSKKFFDEKLKDKYDFIEEGSDKTGAGGSIIKSFVKIWINLQVGD